MIIMRPSYIKSTPQGSTFKRMRALSEVKIWQRLASLVTDKNESIVWKGGDVDGAFREREETKRENGEIGGAIRQREKDRPTGNGNIASGRARGELATVLTDVQDASKVALTSLGAYNRSETRDAIAVVNEGLLLSFLLQLLLPPSLPLLFSFFQRNVKIFFYYCDYITTVCYYVN